MDLGVTLFPSKSSYISTVLLACSTGAKTISTSRSSRLTCSTLEELLDPYRRRGLH